MANKALSEAEAQVFSRPRLTYAELNASQHLCRQPEYKAFLQGIEDAMNSKESTYRS